MNAKVWKATYRTFTFKEFVAFFVARACDVDVDSFRRRDRLAELAACGYAVETIGRSEVALSGYGLKVFCRRHSSDIDVIHQIFIRTEYSYIVDWIRECHDADHVTTIIDAGANCGASSLYFSREFPRATIIALEPSKGNYEMLARNVASFVQILPRSDALWHRNAALKPSPFRDGMDWSKAFVEKTDNDHGLVHSGDVRGVTLRDVIREQRVPLVDLLKIDIEGGEARLFTDSAFLDDLSSSVRYLAVEIHEECISRELVLHTLERLNFDCRFRGETLFARKMV